MSDLPDRVIVDQHGHYWRDYGDSYSMCPVSDENNETQVAAVFVRVDDPPSATDDEPRTANGRDLLAHAVQYAPTDADRRVTAAKIRAVENEAAATPEPTLDAERLAGTLHSHDVPGVGSLWWDADGHLVGGPEDD